MLFALLIGSASLIAGAIWLAELLSTKVGFTLFSALAGLTLAASMWGIRWVWVLVLNFYSYDAHSLRPIAKKEHHDGDAD